MVELNRGGMVLGPNPEAAYERHYTSLSPGTVFLAYTDGITEAEDALGESFGVERLRRIVRSREWTYAKDLVETVFDAVQAFSGKEQPDDDQTVLAVVRARSVTP
jgi:sigma-B regulation protein RsbU (phosphoserine phosphatase)